MDDPARSRRAEEVFQLAADLTGPAREELLVDRCAGDPELRGEVEGLLLHLESGDQGFLERPAFAGTLVPERLGRYRIVRLIGEGGMASVYEAEQENPRRRVALKLIRLRPMDHDGLRRFELEAAVLGHLRHPGIAAIYEAGTFPGDRGGPTRPYFAMEYVAGVPLDQHARDHGLGLRQRLSLIADLCDAVHHAHQKGVIHRDLKPANILVDDSGRPKILDFGVARATHADLGAASMHTEAGQVVGTLAYMSPEQIAGLPAELDTRSDVYALGVILYQLLSGRLPYQVAGRSIPEAGRVIREDDPSPLSSVSAPCRGDVETIVGKALAKEKERRYQSAAELGADIRRYLHDEPITARRAGMLYQFRKFAKRNSGLVGGVAAAAAVLVVALVIVSVVAVRARADSRRAEEISQFLASMLAPADAFPTGAELPKHFGANVKYMDVLDERVRQLDREPLNDPIAEAEIRQMMAMAYFGAGRFRDGERNAEHAVGLFQPRVPRNDPHLLGAKLALAHNKIFVGELHEAKRLALEALHGFKAVYGSHEQTLRAMQCLWIVYLKLGYPEDGAAVCREMLELIDSAPRPLDYARYTVQTQLAFLYIWALRRPIEGEALAERALRDGLATHAEAAAPVGYAYMTLGGAALARGDYHKAEDLWRKGMDIWLAVTGGAMRPEFEPTLGRLISMQSEPGRKELGLSVMRGSLEEAKRTPDNPALAASAAADLASRLLGRDCPPGDAAAAFEEYFRIAEALPPTQSHAHMHAQFAVHLLAQGRREDAEREYREAIRIADGFSRDEWMRHRVDDRGWLARLAGILADSGRSDEAGALYQTLRARLHEHSDPWSQKSIAWNLCNAQRFDDALVLAEQAVDGLRRHPEPAESGLIDALDTMAIALLALDRVDQAETAWLEAAGRWLALPPEGRGDATYTMVAVGEFLAQRGQRQTAEPVRQAALRALKDSGATPEQIERARSRLDAFRRQQPPADAGGTR